MDDSRRSPKPCIDPFTARAGACLLLVIAVGFLCLSIHALATGCIRLKYAPHGPGIMHCAPETPYWVASLSSLVLGSALVFVCGKLLRIASNGSRAER